MLIIETALQGERNPLNCELILPEKKTEQKQKQVWNGEQLKVTKRQVIREGGLQREKIALKTRNCYYTWKKTKPLEKTCPEIF